MEDKITSFEAKATITLIQEVDTTQDSNNARLRLEFSPSVEELEAKGLDIPDVYELASGLYSDISRFIKDVANEYESSGEEVSKEDLINALEAPSKLLN